MISISTDLFQTIVLALLFVILIALIALLSALNGLRKTLGPGPAQAAADTYAEPSDYQGYNAPVASDSSYGYASASEPVAAQPVATQPVAAQPVASEPAAARPEVSTGYVSVSEVAPEPAATISSTPTLTGTEPEEQPFERDGRWWFKRGAELLVYDEGTGQWVTAGNAASTPAPAASATSGGTQTEYVTSMTAGDPGEGWRCSSCGAINGSTATACRMCFTPR